MLRRHSANSKSAWLCRRRSNVAMISLPRQAGAARPAHRQDEGPAELGVVVGVELLDARELLRRAVGQPGLALLVRALGGQRLG
jgi:hypothetical protein